MSVEIRYISSTQEAEALECALKKRGVAVYREIHDGYKHVDLRIPKARLDIEVDGIQHLTDPKQIVSDLARGYYSYKNGYDTLHIPNEILRGYLDEIADALKEAVEIRRERIRRASAKRREIHVHLD